MQTRSGVKMTVAGAEGLSGDFQLFSGISWLSGLHVILLVTQVLREWALYPFCKREVSERLKGAG